MGSNQFNLQNYWKLGGKKVRNQIGSCGKNREMWILRYKIELKLLAACWNLFSSFFGQKLDQIPESIMNSYLIQTPVKLGIFKVMYSSLVFKMLIKPNQDQIELHTLLPMMEQNLVRSCFKMSSFCKIGWIDIFFHFFCYSFAFRVFKWFFFIENA